MNWGLGQGTQMKMNYEAQFLGLFSFSAHFFFAFSLVLESVVHHTGDNLHGHVSVHTQVYVGYFVKCFRMPLCDMTPCYFVFRNTTVCV